MVFLSLKNAELTPCRTGTSSRGRKRCTPLGFVAQFRRTIAATLPFFHRYPRPYLLPSFFPIEVDGFLPCERCHHTVCSRVLGRGSVAGRLG